MRMKPLDVCTGTTAPGNAFFLSGCIKCLKGLPVVKIENSVFIIWCGTSERLSRIALL